MLLYLLNIVTLILCAVALGLNQSEVTNAALITGIVVSTLVVVCGIGVNIYDKWKEIED